MAPSRKSASEQRLAAAQKAQAAAEQALQENQKRLDSISMPPRFGTTSKSTRFGALASGVVAKKDSGMATPHQFEIESEKIQQRINAHNLRGLQAQEHVASITADTNEVQIETASNNYFKATVERDISELQLDQSLIKRDISEEQLAQSLIERSYNEVLTPLLTYKYAQELRAISLDIEIKEFNNDHTEELAKLRGTEISARQFTGMDEAKKRLQELKHSISTGGL